MRVTIYIPLYTIIMIIMIKNTRKGTACILKQI